MKHKISVLFFLLFTMNSFSQSNSFILGKWNVIAASDGEIYHNFKTDSISVSQKIKERFPDSAELENYINTVKLIYQSNCFEFLTNDIYRKLLDDKIFQQGKYLIDSSENKIILTLKNQLGTPYNDEMKYFTKDKYLHLIIDLKSKIIEFVLEKERP